MKEPDEIDRLFQSAFDGLELNPDPSVKAYIDHAIASKKKRRRFLFILFPVLFGIAGFAAILPFIRNEKQKENEKIIHQDIQEINGTDTHSYTTISSTEEEQLSGSSIKTNRLFAIPRSTEGKSDFLFDLPTGKFISPNPPVDSEIETRTREHLSQTNTTPEKSEDQNLTKQDSIAAHENKPDSIFASSPTDSTGLLISKALEKTSSNKVSARWSLAVLTYWEGEKKRAVDFNNIPFIDQKRETARIHSSTFYGKIEINRRFAERWEVLTGIGFRSSKIIQYGYLEKIELTIQSITSGVPQPITPPMYDTVRSKETQSFSVHSLVLPIGFAYLLPVGNRLKLRFSAGGEFAYGQIRDRKSDPDLSSPKFNPFGFNLWLRPEVDYSFGKISLFGFGTFDQALSQQLKWNFEPRRNPAFGVGLGLRISL